MNWYVILSLLPFLRPEWLPNYSKESSNIILIWELLAIISLLILYIKNRKTLTPIVWAFGAMELWMLLSAFIHGEYGLLALIYVAAPTGFIVLLFNYFIDDPKTLVSSVMLDFEIVLYLDLMTMIAYKGTGIMTDSYYGYAIYLLGEDNQLISYIFPALALALLYLGQCDDKLCVARPVLLFVACLYMVYTQFPATTVVGVSVCIALLLLYFLFPKCREILSFPVLYLFTLIGHFLIVEYRITENVPTVTRFVENVLHKSASMSARTPLWDAYYALFDNPEKVIFGLGYCPLGNVTVQRSDKTLVTMYTHNEYYEMVAQGGIIQLLLLFVVVFLTGKKLFETRGTYTSVVLTAVLTGACCSWLCEGHVPIFWIVFLLAYFSDKIEPSIVPWGNKA